MCVRSNAANGAEFRADLGLELGAFFPIRATVFVPLRRGGDSILLELGLEIVASLEELLDLVGELEGVVRALGSVEGDLGERELVPVSAAVVGVAIRGGAAFGASARANFRWQCS